MAQDMEFWLLGPLVVRRGGVVVPLPRGHQRAVMAALLLSVNQVVSVDELAEVLWEQKPPASARVTVQNYVKRLRTALGQADRDRIGTRPDGYLIHVGAGELDVAQFEVLVAAARAAARNGSWDQASADANAALGLCRGEPLADVGSQVLALREAPRLVEMRLQALEARVEADLHLGRHADVIPELQRLTRERPLREHLHALLMLALYRCGRQGEALGAYAGVRGTLMEELGAEPGSELRELHRRILVSDSGLAAPRPALRTADPAAPPVPRHLPATTAHFAGRAGELAALNRLLDEAGGGTPGTLVICAVGGTAGVGKTALALRWAHQVAQRFRDGQLYVNLRGFDPSGIPATPADAIRGFLDALGTPPHRIPPDPAAQAGLYRSLMACKQVLIVLDNARDEQQVRPLLPVGPGCLVIVTSRGQLTGLAAAEGARLLTLDVLSHAEARQMVGARLGSQRAAAEQDAVDEIVRLCARLPLAMAIAAAHAAARPQLPLADLAAILSDAHSRLDALDTGDPTMSVRAVFSWSARQLGPVAARLFRVLGLHSGPDITASAAASLAGIELPAVRRTLRELTAANLLTEHVPGRYAFHDLLRAYAIEQAEASEDSEARRAAVRRVLGHYLHAARIAAILVNPGREPVSPDSPQPGITPEPLADPQQALTWFEAEHQVLLAAVSLAADTGFDTCAWQLPWAMTDFLIRRGHWRELAVVQHTALAAATRLGDLAGQAAILRSLGKTYISLGDHNRASEYLADCIPLYEQLGDRLGEALAHQSLCMVAEQQGRYTAAMGHAQRALRLSRTSDHPAGLAGQASALNAVGWCHALLGNYREARSFCQQAMPLIRQAGHRNGEAHTWDSLGYANHQLGDLAQAAACYQHALGIFREVGDRYNEAATLGRLGDTRQAAGSPRRAREAWQQAMDILDDLDHPDAGKLRLKLRQP